MTFKEQRCEGTIAVRGGFRTMYEQCGNTGRHEHEGKHYCKIHHPLNVEARREESDVRMRAKLDADKAELEASERAAAEQRRRAECYDGLLSALKLAMPALEYLREQHPRCNADDSIDVLAVCRAAIAKATGGAA